MATNTTEESDTFRRSDMMMPPTIVMGARRMTFSDSSTTIWTCCTSFVVRVIRDGVPKRFTSASEKVSTLRKRMARTSRPRLIATLEPL